MPSERSETAPDDPLGADNSVPDPAGFDIALLRGRSVAYTKVPRHIQLSQLVLIYGLVATPIGLFSLVRSVAASAGVPRALFLTAGGVVLLAAAALAVRWMMRRSADQGEAIGRTPAYGSVASGRRIQVYAKPLAAIAMLRSIEETRHGFEPEVARVPLAVGLDPGARRLAWLGGAFGLVLGVAFELVLHRALAELSMTIWFLMGTTALGAVAVPEFFFPTYVRVLPGRLDVIRAPLGPGRLRVVASFDLRTRSMSLVGPVVFIEPVRAPGEPRPPRAPHKTRPDRLLYPPDFVPDAVSLSLTPARRRLKLAVIRGATTEAPTPDVPADQLIG